jgi:hypothetical protein
VTHLWAGGVSSVKVTSNGWARPKASMRNAAPIGAMVRSRHASAPAWSRPRSQASRLTRQPQRLLRSASLSRALATKSTAGVSVSRGIHGHRTLVRARHIGQREPSCVAAEARFCVRWWRCWRLRVCGDAVTRQRRKSRRSREQRQRRLDRGREAPGLRRARRSKALREDTRYPWSRSRPRCGARSPS